MSHHRFLCKIPRRQDDGLTKGGKRQGETQKSVKFFLMHSSNFTLSFSVLAHVHLRHTHKEKPQIFILFPYRILLLERHSKTAHTPPPLSSNYFLAPFLFQFSLKFRGDFSGQLGTRYQNNNKVWNTLWKSGWLYEYLFIMFWYNIPEIWPLKWSRRQASPIFRVALWSRALPETGPCLAPASCKAPSSSNALDLGASCGALLLVMPST